MTEAEFIARIKPHVPQEGFASSEALLLVTAAIDAFPESAELWFWHGRILMAAAEDEVWDTAGRSFEMAFKLDPTMTEAHEAWKSHHKAARLRKRSVPSPNNPTVVRRPRL